MDRAVYYRLSFNRSWRRSAAVGFLGHRCKSGRENISFEELVYQHPVYEVTQREQVFPK